MKFNQKIYINYITSIIKFISKTDIFCLLLLWFIVILIMGTISQKEIGIFSAQQKYFSSILIWVFDEKIPVLGGKMVLFLIFINLFAKIFSDKFNTNKIGTFCMHIGVLYLIFSSIFILKSNEEGNILIKEGNKSNIIITNNNYILTLTDNSFTKVIKLTSFNAKSYKILLDYNIQIKNFYLNAGLTYKHNFLKKQTLFDISRFFNLQKKTLFLESENNKAGVVFTFLNKNSYKTYYLLENICNKHILKFKDKNLIISLNKSIIILPFELHLLKFEKETYPGTQIAKSYKSKLFIKETNGINWHYNIEMNKPLKYKNYTFYQTSFIEDATGNITILSVTKNSKNYVFYISGIIMCFGLIIHIFNYLKKYAVIKN